MDRPVLAECGVQAECSSGVEASVVWMKRGAESGWVGEAEGPAAPYRLCNLSLCMVGNV